MTPQRVREDFPVTEDRSPHRVPISTKGYGLQREHHIAIGERPDFAGERVGVEIALDLSRIHSRFRHNVAEMRRYLLMKVVNLLRGKFRLRVRGVQELIELGDRHRGYGKRHLENLLDVVSAPNLVSLAVGS